MKTPLLALAALSLTTISAAQVTKAGAGYDIKVKYAAGKTYNYNIATSFRAPGAPAGGQAMNIGMTQRVLSVKNGVATVQVSTKGNPQGDAKPQTVKIDNRGKIVGGPTSASNFLTGFPNRPLKVGERWKSTSAVPGGMGGGQANISYVFRGLKSVGGRQAAQIDFTITTAGQAALKGSGSAFVNAADGQLLSSNMKGAITLSGGMGGRPGAKPTAIPLTVNMKRV